MFWDRKKDDCPEGSTSDKPVRRRKLNPELQQLVDREEELVDHLHEGSYGLLYLYPPKSHLSDVVVFSVFRCLLVLGSSCGV